MPEATTRLNADQRRVRDNQLEADRLIAKNESAREKAITAVKEARATIKGNQRKLTLLSDMITESGGKPSDALVKELAAMKDEDDDEDAARSVVA